VSCGTTEQLRTWIIFVPIACIQRINVGVSLGARPAWKRSKTEVGH
jgi:hypothetical protein